MSLEGTMGTRFFTGALPGGPAARCFLSACVAYDSSSSSME